MHRMKLNLVLACVAALRFLNMVRSDDVVITTRRYSFGYSTATIYIGFTSQQFKTFYEKLCKTSTYQLNVELSNTYHPTNQHRSYREDTNANHTCKYYQCYYYYSSNSFLCTNKNSPWESSRRVQSMHYRTANCGVTKCVSISWKFSEENVDYSSIPGTVSSCTSNCWCSTEIQSTTPVTTPNVAVRTANVSTTTASTTKTTQLGTTQKATIKRTTNSTSSLASIPTTQDTSQTDTTLNTTVAVTHNTETTSLEVRETTQTNATLELASDNQTGNDPVPIIVGVVVASILVASIAVVAVFLWKRKKGKTQKPPSDSHEYANLPPASEFVKGFDTASSAVSSSHDLPSSYTNYAFDDSVHYNNEGANYSSLANETSDNTARTYNQPYVNIELSRSHAAAPKEVNHTKDTSHRTSPGYVTISNTIEDSDDLANNIYELANQILGNDPQSPAVSNCSTNVNNIHSQNRTKKRIPSTTAALATTRSHLQNLNAYENDTSYPIETTYTNTEASREILEQTTHPLPVYESAKQISNSIPTDSVYSVSNDDINSDSTYSIAANPTSNTDKVDPSHPHVYAHLGKDAHNTVNPYNALQETNEDPIPKQANIKQSNIRKNADTNQVYSVAESIPEFSTELDNDNQYQGIDSTDEQCDDTYTYPGENTPRVVCPELVEVNDPSRYQTSNDNVYFELEK